jgi:hypothetical protein
VFWTFLFGIFSQVKEILNSIHGFGLLDAVDTYDRGEIPGEEASVDLDHSNETRQSELDETPIMAFSSASSRLPTVHPFPEWSVVILLPNWLLVFNDII